ncbi:MAG: acyltransferase [Chlorobia bacterium]|nr:acyltransferase [Fimbriimonadaceae bacterium]
MTLSDHATITEPENTASLPNSDRPESNRFAWVDILRGLSAFGVVLFHCRVDLYAGWNEIRSHPEAYSAADRLGSYLSLPMAFMGSGVMLFFVLSGFCVHYPYAQARKKFLAGGYAARRLLRIYLPYFAAIILTILLETLAWRLSGPEPSSLSTIWRSLLMVQNYGPEAGQMAGNPSLWSLPVEIELYAAYPLFLWIMRRFGIKWSLAFVGVVSGLSCLAMNRGGTFPDGGFLPYWIIWCTGAAVAECAVAAKLRLPSLWLWVGTVSCLAASIATTLLADHLMLKQYVWTSFYLGLLVLGLRSSKIQEWVACKPGRWLVGLGAITYSLYLIHFPLLRVMGAAWVKYAGDKPSNIAVPVLGALLCLPLAYMFFRLVEKPSHEWARRLGEYMDSRRAISTTEEGA